MKNASKLTLWNCLLNDKQIFVAEFEVNAASEREKRSIVNGS